MATSKLGPQYCLNIPRFYGPEPCLPKQRLFECGPRAIYDLDEIPEEMFRFCGLERVVEVVEAKGPSGVELWGGEAPVLVCEDEIRLFLF